MLSWKLVTLIVCSFGFFKDLRPSEAYLTAYLTGPWKNLTETEVDNEIYPWWTYSYLLWLLPMFLLTDYFRYKPILILDGVAYIVTWALLLWAQGVPAMKGMQVTYGLATACEIGYYSYLYAVVTKDHFQKVASFTKAASLLGKFVAYLCGQLLVSFDVMDFFQLNIFSFVSVIIAFIITIILPRAKHSELFNPRIENSATTPKSESVHEESNADTGGGEKTAKSESTKEEKVVDTNNVSISGPRSLIMFLFDEVKTIYANKSVLIWSVWWAFASCGNFQVGNYIQNLWHILTPYKNDRKQRHLYNGAVEAAGTLFSSGTVLLVGFLPIDWSVRGRCEVLMAAVCGLNAAMLIIMGKTTSIWVCYVLYDVFRATYQIVITIATAQIAEHLSRQRYGFVFGCNTFLALLIETILTAIVVDESGLDVDIQTQFMVYGGYFAVMTGAFLTVAIVTIVRSRTTHRRFYNIGSNEANLQTTQT
ncbi:thiamine transporter 2-like [Mercenaria mercenaria]|uniref:thiamine transporter 2-like n=1 Tax=Mercenaria mercenaria TaxID=6596 RepID=UPI00234E5687|nr:thiamine transporter 2-like [Mercenaria mercenaria]XP_053404514.1 thiamine transporter 2-like [Mercenaria mercenaria]